VVVWGSGNKFSISCHNPNFLRRKMPLRCALEILILKAIKEVVSRVLQLLISQFNPLPSGNNPLISLQQKLMPCQ
jgi:hypothetical protein